MWRAEDIFFGAFGGGGIGNAIATPEEIADRAPRRPGRAACPACPFMHGTAHWMAFQTLYTGGTVVISPDRHLDPVRLWRARRPRAGELPRDRRRRVRPPARGGARHGAIRRSTCRGCTVLLSGGAILSPTVKQRLADEAARRA